MRGNMVSHTRHTVVFFDPGYPQVCATPTLHKLVPAGFTIADAAHLAEHLDGQDTTLVSFHGPYFPKAAWRAILRFLKAGGNLAIFGGMPFARPVDEAGRI